MSDALSYVYRGKEGTGVAQVLKQPTPAKPEKQDTSYLDSLGDDIRKLGPVWEVDRPAITQMRNDYLDLLSRAYASKKDPRTDLALQKELLDRKALLIDAMSKSARDQAAFSKGEPEFKRNPDLYAPEEIEKFYKRKETPLAEIYVPQRYSTKDVTDVYNTGKNHYETVRTVTRDKEGKEVSSYKDVFKTDEARKVWNEYANANQGTAPFIKAFKIAYKDLEDEMGDAFTTKSEQEKGALVNKKMEDNYLLFSAAKKRNQGTGYKAAHEDKEGSGATTTPIDVTKDYTMTWKYDGNGNVVKKVSWNINPVNEKLKDIENKLQWTDTTGKVYIGKLIRPTIDEYGNAMVTVSIADMKPNKFGDMVKVGDFEKELPLTDTNKKYLRDFYKFDIDKALSKDAAWRKDIENLQLPTVLDFPAFKTPERQKTIQSAIDKRKTNKSTTTVLKTTTAPKAKTAGKTKSTTELIKEKLKTATFRNPPQTK